MTRSVVLSFLQNFCEFQDLASGKMIGSARETRGIHYFEKKKLTWMDKLNIRVSYQTLVLQLMIL